MTWFRVGGAGIPATLKNAMNAVFNKKFGTSGQNYPPKQWPDDVNLLGPLPEGTASGPIANFSDGADDVPTKNVIATIAPTLTGVSSLAVTKTGESLANIADVSGSMTNAYFYNIGSDYVLTAGTTYKIVMEVNSTVTPFAVSVGVGDNAYRYDIYNTGINNKNGIVAFEFTVEASHIATWNKLWIRAPRYSAPSEPATPTTCTFTVKNITLYTSAIVCPASLGRLIYGGTADLVNGTGTEKNSAPLTFDGSEDWRADTTRNGVYLLFSTMGTQTYGDGVCNMFTTIKAGSGLNSLGICFGVNNYAIYIPHLFDGSIPEVTDVATWQTYLSSHDCTISYPLATQIDFTFDGQEINSLYGVNNFWNDAGGDTTVAYRRDIDLALQAVSSSRGLMMASRPVTQLVGEESDPDQVNELVEDDEIEQEGEDNAR